MQNALGDDLASYLLGAHPTFRSAQAALLQTVRRFGSISLDEAARLTAYPTRTLLLVASHLVGSEELVTRDGQIQECGSRGQKGQVPASLGAEWRRVPEISYSTYVTALEQLRPEPALLWTQRWLTPGSSRLRAEYIVNHALLGDGPIVFLGEDDATSPLVALLEPQREIVVIDVDSAVLEMVGELATRLGSRLSVIHHDLSQGLPQLGCSPAAIVCDPFPTRDGSFERAFWTEAAEAIADDRLLFTTSHPSHKPAAFARQALRALDHAGFVLVDVVRNAGEYETFDFELMKFERRTLEALGLSMETSHTKSLICARKVTEPDVPDQTVLRESPLDMATHYLTQQYGTDEQIRLAQSRGRGQEHVERITSGSTAPFLTVPALLKGMGSDVDQARFAELLDAGNSVAICDYLAAVGGLICTLSDAQLLVSLHRGQIPETLPAERLALVVRALESWHR
jgi:hypothetical protein